MLLCGAGSHTTKTQQLLVVLLIGALVVVNGECVCQYRLWLEPHSKTSCIGMCLMRARMPPIITDINSVLHSRLFACVSTTFQC